MLRLICLATMLLATPAGAANLRDVSDSYLAALCPTLARGASSSDVDRALTYCTDDVVYEHPLLGVRIEGKANVRAGMLAHLADYVGSHDDSGVLVLSRIVGNDAVALRIRETFVASADGKAARVDREKLRVLEFTDGRIRRILDY
jgi:hypothetical protein